MKGEPLRFVRGHNTRKDGVTFSSTGRKMIFVGREHPMAQGNGYVMEHRLIVASDCGRMLSPDEHVHHIDLDETNNAITNLALLSESQHKSLHNLIRAGTEPGEALRLVRSWDYL